MSRLDFNPALLVVLLPSLLIILQWTAIIAGVIGVVGFAGSLFGVNLVGGFFGALLQPFALVLAMVGIAWLLSKLFFDGRYPLERLALGGGVVAALFLFGLNGRLYSVTAAPETASLGGDVVNGVLGVILAVVLVTLVSKLGKR